MSEGLVTWSFPTSIVFGAGAVGKVAERVKLLGATRALVVCDPGVVKVGIAERVRGLLEAGGFSAAVFYAVATNTVEKNVCEAAAAVDGARFGSATVPPMITIPTTAGTGSEVGRSGVVTLAATGRKTVIFSPHLLAKVAVLDPELTRSMPARVTAATGFDALTHCLEAFCSLGDHPMADAIAVGGLELCAASLARAVERGDDLVARGAMMKAAMMGAVAFQKGLGACHSLAHPLSSEKGLHHGLANALCLPAVVEFNSSAVAPELQRVRDILDAKARTCA